MLRSRYIAVLVIAFCYLQCGKKDTPVEEALRFISVSVDGASSGFAYSNVGALPVIKFNFSTPVKVSSVTNAVSFTSQGAAVPYNHSTEDNNKTIIITPVDSLNGFTEYAVSVSKQLLSENDQALVSAVNITLTTGLDSSNKFPVIPDEELLTLVQRQTFKYFWDFAHPVSGLARERNTSGDIVTSGGSGFGIMAIIAGVQRGFISREEALSHMKKAVAFLKNTAETFHGAYPHWLNGATGEAVPFSQKDNGADLVETSYLIQGLLTARQFFNGVSTDETNLRADINEIWERVEWDWFTRGGSSVLYWHWSPDFEWEMNMPIQGWNECLITYVLAASSPTHSIPKNAYDSGWARLGAFKNNNTYYGVKLPLGPPLGGPLFFAHYSFLGIDPNGLSDAYADYWEQNVAHTMINYNYCEANPEGYAGYSGSVWGLTASDNNKSGYSAHSPENDLGVISPTAALSSFPYTPDKSMDALKFFYYKLGDKIWKEYGFVDAFNITDKWFANSFLAIDQGPIIIMLENYRSQLLWNLFMSAAEVKEGLTKLGFQSPHL